MLILNFLLFFRPIFFQNFYWFKLEKFGLFFKASIAVFALLTVSETKCSWPVVAVSGAPVEFCAWGWGAPEVEKAGAGAGVAGIKFSLFGLDVSGNSVLDAGDTLEDLICWRICCCCCEFEIGGGRMLGWLLWVEWWVFLLLCISGRLLFWLLENRGLGCCGWAWGILMVGDCCRGLKL